MNKDIKILSPFKRMLITIGELPTAYIESMSYYEGLTYLVNYLCNNVIPALNQNGEAVKELQDKYLELVQYVDDYFENLDVQTEINNKLDDMATEGELAPIIAQYLEMYSLLMFDTVADLKAVENISENSFAGILGRYTYDDGLGAKYKIRALDVSDVIDDYNIISLTNYPSLVAERIESQRLIDIEDDIDTIEGNITGIGEDITGINNDITGINTKIGDLANLDTTDKTSIVNAINDNRNYTNTKMSSYSSFKDQFYYYVDSVNGNDNNDGLTSENAFKTLDRFFDLLNTSSADIRCYINSAGTYKLSHSQIINAHVHIVGNTLSRNDIIITSDEAEMIMYGGHFNFKNITWNMNYNYFDNSLLALDNCVVIQPIRTYGSSVEIKNSTFNQLRLSWSKAILQNVTIDNQEKSNNAIHLDSCSELTCFDDLTVSNLSSATTYGVIGCWRGTLHLVSNIINNSSSDYHYGITGNHMLIDSTNTVISAFASIGTNGNDLNHALVWTNNQNLPVA